MTVLDLTIAAFLALCLVISPLRADEANLLPNGDFAADSDGDGMADHWTFSGDEHVKTTWGRGPGAHGGYAQRLTCTFIEGTGPATHAMLAQMNTFSLKKDQWYRLSFNAKGEIAGTTVSVAISQMGPWENCGLQDVLRLQPNWRPEEFAFRANRDISTNLRLQIWFTEVGTLWLDDVRLVELPGRPAEAEVRYTEVLPPTQATNLIPNSSFECGTSGWGTTTRGIDWGSSGLTSLFGKLDEATAVDGRHSFRIDLDAATAPVLGWDYYDAVRQPVLDPLVANRGWIDVQPGQDYTLSAYVKSEPAGAPCLLALREAFGDTQRKQFPATGQWQRVVFTFRPNAKQIFVAVGPDLTDSQLRKVTVWVDAVQLEKGPQATNHALRSPVEVGIEWEHPGHLFHSPEDARAFITAYNATDKPTAVHVSAAITDFFDKTAAQPRLALTLPPRSAARKTFSLGVRDKGFYRLRLAADSAAVLSLNAERFAVIEPAPDRTGIFGMNHAYADPQLLQISKQIGLTWFRDWSLKWQQVEPQKGRFDFAMTDFQLNRVLDAGLNLDALLPFPSSEWSTSAPPDAQRTGDLGEHSLVAYKPRDLSEFADYVRAVVSRYKGRVHTWEILNEPLYTGYAVPVSTGHTIEDYVALLKTAYQAIKQEDPTAFVIGGIASSPDALAPEFIAAGGLNWLDGINTHIYPVFSPPERYLSGLQRVNTLMREAGHPKPIYFTEGAYYADDDLPFAPFEPGDSLMRPMDSELECASYIARLDAILLSQNVKMIIYHAGVGGALNQPSVGGIFFEWDGAPRKMAVSLSVTNALLGLDVQFIGSVWDRVRSFAFHSRGRTVVIAWDEKSQHLALAPHGAAPRLLDISGATVTASSIPLGGTPYYLVFDPQLTLDQLQSALRDWIGPQPTAAISGM